MIARLPTSVHGKHFMPTSPPETVLVDHTRVSCDGGGTLGHPRVYLEMGDEDFVECGYCDRRFELTPEAKAHRHEAHSPVSGH
jgi:uncharacterized Zn-finger protein